MNTKKRIRTTLAVFLAMTMTAGLTACGNNKTSDGGGNTDAPAVSEQNAAEGGIKEFTAFFARYDLEIDENNAAKEAIAEKIGAKCKETWLTGYTAEEGDAIIKEMMEKGEYPDLIDASTSTSALIDAGALIAIDDYWDDCPNIKNFRTEAEWNQIRSADGHIYIIPQFSKINMYDTSTVHKDEAFWIQVRVLKWADYPRITTLDEYFDLIDRYMEANPAMDDGTPNVGYAILSDGWRYFGLENPPFFLDGYPNDGCVIVDKKTHQAIDYNTTPTAERYFRKLNEEYNKGIIAQNTFDLDYDAYMDLLSTGSVLGMVDQYWNFQNAETSIKQKGLYECTYVPVGVVIDEGIREHYHSNAALDVSNGIGITVSCKDVEGAMKFLNDLLEPDVQNIRFWGIEGKDYLVDSNGLFYRTKEMRENADDEDYCKANFCQYSYLPFNGGMSLDGINAYSPNYQPAEFYDSLSDAVKECFEAYGVQTYVQLLQPTEKNEPWFPMWSYSNSLTKDTPDGKVWKEMEVVKHEYLPKVVTAEDFDTAWADYMDAYSSRCDIDVFLEGINAEIQRRIDLSKSKR